MGVASPNVSNDPRTWAMFSGGGCFSLLLALLAVLAIVALRLAG